jgi:hypothetical protein
VNDTIIELGLSLLHEKIRQQNPALAAQIHIFSSFFYKRLTENKDKAAGFESVRKWAKTNVFEKKYLVVPINEHLHWYLAIVVNPSFCIAPHALEKRAIEEAERAADSVAPVERRQTRRSVVKGVVLSDDEMEDAVAAASSPPAPAPVSGRASPLNDVDMAAPAAEQPIPAIELDCGTSPAADHAASDSAAPMGMLTPQACSDVSDVAMKGSVSTSVDESAGLASISSSAPDSSELGTPPPSDTPAALSTVEQSNRRHGMTATIPEDAMVPASIKESSSFATSSAQQEHASDPGLCAVEVRHAASSPIKQRIDASAQDQSRKKRSRAQSSGSASKASGGAPSRVIELPESGDESEPFPRAPAAAIPLPATRATTQQQGEALALGGAVSPSASPRKKARRGDADSDAPARDDLMLSNKGRGLLRGGGPTLIRPGENRTPSPSPTPPPPSRTGPSASTAGRPGAQRATAQSSTSGAKYGKQQQQRDPVKPKPVPQKSLEVTERYRGWLKDSTTVCIFDSLGGKHQAVRTNLAGYLTRQHLSLRAQTPPGELKKEELLKTEHIVSGSRLGVLAVCLTLGCALQDVAMPQQPNLSDCGVYVLHTFECFFAAPQRFIEDVIPSRERDHALWRTDVLPGARARWRDEIEALAVSWETAKRAHDEQKKRRKLEAQAAQASSAVPAAPAAQPPSATNQDAASPPAPSAASSGGVEAV